MDIATRTLDLARALSDLSTRGSSLIDGGTTLLQWLAREKIDKREFEYCMDIIRDKFSPNSEGLYIQRSIQKADQKSRAKKLASLSLGVSGSIGRMMASSPEYAYLVTTVAVVLEYHTISFAEKALCSMVLDSEEHRSDGYPAYDVRKTRIRPVIEKVVESIALTIVNSGHALNGLPKGLESICSHSIGHDVFAKTTACIQKHRSASIFMSTDVFPADIVMWLLNHWEGTIEVVLKGRIVYTRAFGHDTIQRRITILISNICDTKSVAHQYGHSCKIDISLDSKDTFEPVLRMNAFLDGVDATPIMNSRFALYDLSRIGKPEAAALADQSFLNHTELNQVMATAQAIAEWLLALPLKASLNNNNGFSIGDPKDTIISVGSLLYHWPTFNRGNFGKLPQHTIVYKSGELHTYRAKQHISQPGVSLVDFNGIANVLECFPPVSTLFGLVQPRCGCEGCKNGIKPGNGKPGCLRETIITVLFTLLGHLVADGFGVPDASGLYNPEILKLLVGKLLREVAIYDIVVWDTWFAVATTVYSGCNWTKLEFRSNDGASNVVALQYGALVAAARWIDINADIPISRSFGIEVGEGQLAGLPDNFAVVQAEQSSYPPPSENEALQDSNWSEIDTCLGTSETYIIGSSTYIYRLLTLVKSGSFVRIVDPTLVIWNKARSISPKCNHTVETSESSQSELSTAWSFTDILREWHWRMPDNNLSLITKVFNSHLKFNVAIGLAPRCLVVREPSCCLTCALETAKSIAETTSIEVCRCIVGVNMESGQVLQITE